ncbi:MAG TPA: hypothetical protein VGX76_10345 [Pirellulales bacterium]|jgi:hypothetical protein|nr:hypothetical protein [Pirellulales bacterium]
MNISTTLLTLAATLGQVQDAPTKAQSDPEAGRQAGLLELYKLDASEYRIVRDADGRQSLELRETPVYIWENRTRSGGQYGAVFVWTCGGCPEVVGSIFSNPLESGGAGRAVLHELHSLSSEVLHPLREASSAANAWSPRTGLARKPVPDAPRPAGATKSRTLQMRSMARDFTAHSNSPYDDQRWELRLLPQPLFRYESTRTDVIDGALFAYVTSAGTDPEIMLILEAIKNGDEQQWHYALARFSDFNLFVEHKGRAIWEALRDDQNVWDHNRDHTYRLYNDRVIDD